MGEIQLVNLPFYGMIANSGELKKKNGVTYSSRAFRAEFSELFKGSRTFDTIGPDRFIITLCDENGDETDYRSFRTAWQTKDKYRKISVDSREPEEDKDEDRIQKVKNRAKNVLELYHSKSWIMEKRQRRNLITRFSI